MIRSPAVTGFAGENVNDEPPWALVVTEVLPISFVAWVPVGFE